MFPMLLMNAIPVLKTIVGNHFIPDSADAKKTVNKLAKELYVKIPTALKFVVSEQTFVTFCITHQDKIFPHKKKTVKKIASKKAAKKVLPKNSPAKKAAKKKSIRS